MMQPIGGLARLRIGLAFALLTVLCGCGGEARSMLKLDQPSLAAGRAALEGGAPIIALNIAAGLAKGQPRDPEVLVLQGDALATIGQMQEARSAYHRALEVKPDYPSALIGLGRMEIRENPAAAEALFLAALAAQPRNAIALSNLGVARDLQGRHAAAQAAYREALGIAPGMHAAEVNLALSLALSSNPAAGQGRSQAIAPDLNASASRGASD